MGKVNPHLDVPAPCHLYFHTHELALANSSRRRASAPLLVPVSSMLAALHSLLHAQNAIDGADGCLKPLHAIAATGC